MARVAAVEPGVPARETGDESRRRQQGAVRLSRWDLDAGRRAGEVGEVEGVGGEGAAGGCGRDGGDVGGSVGGCDVDVGLEEFGAAAVVEVEGGEDDVDAGGLPVCGMKGCH